MASFEEENQSTPYRVLALYLFVTPSIPKDSLKDLQAELEMTCRKYRARGTLLLAEEGINGTICYPFLPKHVKDNLLEFLQSKFNNSLRIRISRADQPVFSRLKIKIKSEIVTMHKDDVHPTECVGLYVKPNKWNDLLEDPDCLVIDTRNDYEIKVGTFRNAVNPHTQSFVEFPQWMSQNLAAREKPPKKVAMFCTGGIRCEKATNAALRLLPKDVRVYHLEGGILAYLDSIKPEKSLFDGECYVFDQRVAVTYQCEPSKKYTTSCRGCRHPLSQDDLKRDDFAEGISCRWCKDRLTEKQKVRFGQRQRQIELARKNGQVHIHDPKEVKQSV